MLQHMGIHVVLCVLLLMLGNKSEQACTYLEVLGVSITQKVIKVKEHSLFNLTVCLHKFTCHEKWNWSRVKLSAYDNGKHFDICKINISNGTCDVAGSSQCVCLHEGFVQFTKRVTQEDSQIFIWKWSDSPSLANEKEREITLFVEKAEVKTVSLILLLTTTISCVEFGIIVIIIVNCVVRHKRHTRVRTSVPTTRVQREEIHMYTALYPQGQRHQEEIQNRVRSSKEMAEPVGPQNSNVSRENQPNFLELTVHPDEYLEPVPTL